MITKSIQKGVFIVLCTSCILPTLLLCHSTHSPIGALSVSSNGRYLVQADGTPFYWFADTEWVLNKHSDDQVHAILNDRAAKGFTVIQVFATRMAWDRSWSLADSWDFDLSWANSDANDQYPFVDGFRAIAEGYADGVNGQNDYNRSADYNRSFMTYHPWATSAEWFHRDDWLDANGIQGSRNEGDQMNDKIVYERVNETYDQENPVKPVLFLEGSYEGEPNRGGSLPKTTPRNVRMQFFYAVIAEKFMTSLKWWNLVPDSSLVISGRGEGEARQVALRSADGKECLVFFPVAKAAEIDIKTLSPSDAITAQWFDPQTGQIIDAGSISTTTPALLTPPGQDDWVLLLTTK